MYHRLYEHLKENDILYKKQFGFQQKHSTEHAILQLIDQVNKSFDRNQFTLGIFIDLSKAFDAVDHKILISKLKNYDVRGCLNGEETPRQNEGFGLARSHLIKDFY